MTAVGDLLQECRPCSRRVFSNHLRISDPRVQKDSSLGRDDYLARDEDSRPRDGKETIE